LFAAQDGIRGRNLNVVQKCALPILSNQFTRKIYLHKRFDSFYYSTNTPDYIAKDLIGRMLTFDNGQEKLGGYIVEAEAYMGKKEIGRASCRERVSNVESAVSVTSDE